jgi:hypothetical protein
MSIQGGTFEGYGAYIRTQDRIAAEREFAKQNPPKVVTLANAWVEEFKQEQAAKVTERARLIAEGKITFDRFGNETQHLQGNKF